MATDAQVAADVAPLAAAPVAGGVPASPVRLHARALTVAIGGRELLRDVSFSLGAAERVVVLGPNGAGKSLLMRVCHGLVAPTRGELVWDGPRAPRQAMVFQRPVLLRRSVMGNVRFALAAHGVKGSAAERAASAALATMDIAALRDRPARRLSGGEQQRVALACAAAIAPDVIWMDEPTSNLDPGATARLERAVVRLAGSGVTVVLATHDIAQARRLAERVLFVHHGRLLEDCTAREFFAGPAHAAARRYLSGELVD